MRASIGNGGWVGIDDAGLPGPLYVRLREDKDGRLRISEFYLDASQAENEITQRHLRELPLSRIEGFLNTERQREYLLANWNMPAPDLSTYASYFVTTFHSWHRQNLRNNWVASSFASQFHPDVKVPGLDPVPPMRRVSRKWEVVSEDRDYRLSAGPVDGLTDDFLRDVARAYAAAAARGEPPNVAIARQTGYSTKSVQRWVYTARLRGIMPRGRKGRVG